MLKLIESLRGRKSAYGPGPVFESWAAKQPWRFFTATVYDITLSAQKFRNVYAPVVSKDRLYLNHSRCFAKQTLDVDLFQKEFEHQGFLLIFAMMTFRVKRTSKALTICFSPMKLWEPSTTTNPKTSLGG